MPYICMIRTDIPEGILQVLDLTPNTSQRNLIYEPPGQTKYIRRLDNDTVAVASNVTQAEYTGLAAWLIDTIEDAGDGGSLSATEANTIATALIVELDAGNALTTSAVNAVIQATVAASGIGLGDSVGTLAGLLKVLAGGEYVLPAGSTANTGAGQYTDAAQGAFTDGQFSDHVLTLTRDLHRWTANFDFIKAQNGNFALQFRVLLTDNPDFKLDYDQRTDPNQRDRNLGIVR